jgi:hypothetical protein
MKNKIVYLFIISMVVVSSCKKEEQQPYSGGVQGGIVTTYIRGYVKDSATNLPLQGAIINNSSISTNVYGRYVCAITYNNNPKYCPPYTAIEAITNNKIGWINLATYYLIPNDTITAPNIYVIPASFAKLHVKDTTMTAAASVHLSCSYEYYY